MRAWRTHALEEDSVSARYLQKNFAVASILYRYINSIFCDHSIKNISKILSKQSTFIYRIFYSDKI